MTSHILNLLNRWQPVPQYDLDEGNFRGRLLMWDNNMVEMSDYQPDNSQSEGELQGGEGGSFYRYHSRRRFGIILATTMLLCLGLITFKGNFPSLRKKNRNSSKHPFSSSNVQPPTLLPPDKEKPHPMMLLPPFTLETVLKHPISPQAKALEWMERHPEVHVGRTPHWRVRQLMAISTLMYAYCGKMPPNAYMEHECNWGKELGFHIECTKDKKIQTWKKPKCEAFKGYSSVSASSARLPPEISMLTSLQNLYLPHSDIGSSLPTELGELTALTYLGLGMNQLRGSIPSQLGRLTQLTSLLLNDNQITGPLPSQVGLLTTLEWLSIYDNQLKGHLPTQLLQDMTALKTIDLHNNRLSGTVPNNLNSDSLQNLIFLRLDKNSLTGNLPTALGQLTALTGLVLAHNQFKGYLPTQLGLLSNLRMGLLLGDNQLSGTIPVALSELTQLKELGLATNQFRGTLPTELGRLTDLQQFSVHDNVHVEGPLPTETIAQWQDLSILWLFNTSLTGTLPCEFRTTPNLKLTCDRIPCPCARQDVSYNTPAQQAKATGGSQCHCV